VALRAVQPQDRAPRAYPRHLLRATCAGGSRALLSLDPDRHLFRPRDAVDSHKQRRRAARKSPRYRFSQASAHPLLRQGRRRGRPINRSTLERWRTRGVRGPGDERVILETMLIGTGIRATTVEALERFFGKLNGTDLADGGTPSQLRRQHERTTPSWSRTGCGEEGMKRATKAPAWAKHGLRTAEAIAERREASESLRLFRLLMDEEEDLVDQ
jgi:hypothetical protein